VESLVRVGSIETSGRGKIAVFRFGKQAKQDVIGDGHNMSSGETGLILTRAYK
jgi:hypothetical protein